MGINIVYWMKLFGNSLYLLVKLLNFSFIHMSMVLPISWRVADMKCQRYKLFSYGPMSGARGAVMVQDDTKTQDSSTIQVDLWEQDEKLTLLENLSSLETTMKGSNTDQPKPKVSDRRASIIPTICPDSGPSNGLSLHFLRPFTWLWIEWEKRYVQKLGQRKEADNECEAEK